jgi:hypothetical protein
MTTQRMAHGVQFTACPECTQPIGTRGLARHLAAHAGTAAAPATKPAKARVGSATKGMTKNERAAYWVQREAEIAARIAKLS